MAFGFGSLGLTREDFVQANKRASGRAKDLADIESLGDAPTGDPKD